MNGPNFVLTTVGTSLFTNLCKNDRDLQDALKREANASALPPDLAPRVETLAEQALAALRGTDIGGQRRLSAELNGLYGFYEGRLPNDGRDIYWLITTDTALGRRAGKVLQDFLREKGQSVEIYTPESLSTARCEDFSEAMKELLCWCEERIPGYRQCGYNIIFNLTGAFKSLQGYLTIAGMFYANQIVYIFETGSQLMSIPRLPLRVDEDALRQHRVELAMMEQGRILPAGRVAGVPAGLLEERTIEGQRLASLSGWGQLVWNRVREQILTERLLEFPGLDYTEMFRQDFEEAGPRERVQLQEKLAKVAGIIEDKPDFLSALKQDHGLQYDNYESQKLADGTPIGHFRVSHDLRVSCIAWGRILVLRRFGREPEVNKNP